MIVSQLSTRAAGVAACFAPASTSGLVLAGLRFQTATSCPTAINRCAIDAPIRPVPHTPIFMVEPQLDCGLLALVGVVDAEILRDQFFIVLKVADFPCEDAASGVEDDGGIGNIDRKLEILFDQNDRLLLFF